MDSSEHNQTSKNKIKLQLATHRWPRVKNQTAGFGIFYQKLLVGSHSLKHFFLVFIRKCLFTWGEGGAVTYPIPPLSETLVLLRMSLTDIKIMWRFDF